MRFCLARRDPNFHFRRRLLIKLVMCIPRQHRFGTFFLEREVLKNDSHDAYGA
jgi:hypothetical protein